MDTGVLVHLGEFQDRFSLVPVIPGVDRASIRHAPHEVPVLPSVPCGLPFGFLRLVMKLEERDERRR